MSSVHEITDEQFAQEVLESDTPVLVEFWAPWCGPCRQLGPVLEQLAEERAGSLKVVKINQDENPVVSADYRVMGLPTMLVFDLEYQGLTIGDDSRIWLIGICAVVSGRQKYEFLWADSPLKERRNILTLFERLEKSGRMPVVTWSGRTADLPQLRNAMTRLRIRRSCHALFAGHIDALAFLCSNMRLPIPAFGLKDVAEYFGIARESGVADGREANVMYRQYREARGKEKTSLRRELQGYNRDDLRCVAEIVGRLASV